MRKLYLFMLTVSVLSGFVMTNLLYADQVIYVDIADFSPALSQFGVEVKGNTWKEVPQEGALGGTAFGAPGDNNHGSDGGEPYLVIKLPIPVKAGESTDDGMAWDAWARLYEPASLTSATAANSFFLRVSPDAKSWIPANRGDTSLRFNDPGATFPDSINDTDLLFTDVGDQLPWFWEKHSANGQSSIDPILAVGVNYIEVGIRESDPTDFPRIDVICLRNDGGQPSDTEAKQLLVSVEPQGKLASVWGKLKAQ